MRVGKPTRASARQPVSAAVKPSHRATRPSPPYPLKLQLEQLEPRLLLSADGLGIAPELALPGEQPVYAAVTDSTQSAEPALGAVVSSRELVFIDPRVPDARALLAGIIGDADASRKFEVIVLDTQRDGIVQVTAALKSRMQLDAVHFITHGSDGAIQLGGTLLDARALAENTALVGAWGDSLKEDADLLFYGCDLAATARGRALVDWIAELTGADVAASTDATGNATKGGNWTLEYSIGAIEAHLALSQEAQEEWFALLNLANLTPAQDTYVNKNSNNSNYGASTQLLVDKSGGGDGDQRTLLQFDLSSIPAGATINSATLQMQATAITGTINNIGVYEVLQGWNEGTGTGGNGAASWDQRVSGTNWTTSGGTYNPAAVATVNASAPGQQSWDIKALVQAWVNGTKVNNGVLIASPDSGNEIATYDSREGATPPRLVIDYSFDTPVNTTTGNTQENAAVARDVAGNYVVVWQSLNQDGSNWGVYAQRYNAAGVAQGPEFLVNTSYTANEQMNPAVAMDDAGNFVVTWQSWNQAGASSLWDVYAQRYSAAGVAQGGAILVNTTTALEQQKPAVAMDAAGNFVVTWQTNNQDGDNNGIYARRFSNAGAALTTEFQVNSGFLNAQESPAIAMNGAGSFVIAWQSMNQVNASSSWDIYAQRYDNTGALLGGEFLVNSFTGKEQMSPAVAMDAAGNFVIAWQSKDQAGASSNFDIYARRYNAAGTALSGEIPVNTAFTSNEQQSPAVAMDAVGNFTITWQSKDQDGSNWGVYARDYDAAGTAQGAAFKVNAYTTNIQEQPAIATNRAGAGNYVVAWNGEGVGDSAGIFSQRFLAPVAIPLAGVSGTIFHDVDGDADVSLGDGTLTFSGALVHLYRDADGIINGNETFVATAITNGTGGYSFGGLSADNYYVVVDSKTLNSGAAYNTGYGSNWIWAEQTYGVTGAAQGGGFLVASGALFGGRNANVSDNFSIPSFTSSEHITKVVVAGVNVIDVNSGFSFNAITSDRDGDDDGATNRTVQGSLRQFLINANAITNASFGIQSSDFTIGSGARMIALTSALPTITESVILNAATQQGFAGTPLIELNGAGAGAGTDGLSITGGGSTVRGFVINRFRGDGIDIATSGGNTIVGNWIGTTAAGTLASANNGVGIRIASGNNTVGGATALDRNVISGNDQDGVYVTTSSGNVVRGNYIGLDVAGSSAVGNRGTGVWVHNTTGPNTIGGPGAGEGNVISGNGAAGGWQGVLIQNSSGNVVQGNIVGLNAAGTLARPNAGAGVELNSTSANNLVSNNVVSGNTLDGVVLWNTSGNTIRSNLIGSNAAGTAAIGNGDYGIWITTDAMNNTIGGLNAGDGNLITGNGYRLGSLDGIEIDGNSSTGNAILGNRIYANAGLGIDIANDGVNANDGLDVDVGPNSRQNYPVLTSVATNGSQVQISGTLNSGASSTFRIEFFASATDDPSGYGEGQRYLGFVNVTTNGSGNATFTNVTLAAAVAAGEVVSATATNIGTNDTSEFAQNRTATAAVGAISGTLYHDVDADADVVEPSAQFANATVMLYVDDGDGMIGVGDAPVATTFTNGTGQYTFTGLLNGVYYVVVDSRTLAAPAYNAGFGVGNIWAEQTFAAAGAAQGAGFTGAGGALYGGRNATVSDNATTISGAEHVTRVNVAGAAVTGIDSGFSFNVVTNVRGDANDDDASRAGVQQQGTLRQFIDNANAIVDQNEMRFVPAVATNDSAGPNTWWEVNVTGSALSVITDRGTIIDGTAYQAVINGAVRETNIGVLGAGGTVGVQNIALSQVARPELEIVDGGGFAVGIDVNAPETAIRDLAIHGFGNGSLTGDIRIQNVNSALSVIERNVIGMTANGTDPGGSARSQNQGIQVSSGDNGTIRNNLIGYTGHAGINLYSDAIGWNITDNEIRGVGQIDNGWDGINMVWGASATIRGNLISNNLSPGIDVALNSGNVIIENNTITGNATVASAERYGVDFEDSTGANVLRWNVISGNVGAGVIVTGATSRVEITENLIFGNTGVGIDLNAIGASTIGDGVTLNDSGDVDSGPNSLQNFPVISTAATTGATVTISGTLNSTASSNYRLEFFASPAADPSGHGEGERFLGSMTVTTDLLGNASFTTPPFAAIVGLGEAVSATATDLSTNRTSEFALSVTAAPPNTPPVANNASVFGPEDVASVLVNVTATDLEGPVASFRLASLPVTGSLYTDAALTILAMVGTDYAASGNALTLYFVPAANWNGVTDFQFTVTDAGGLVDATPATATINVLAVNDPGSVGITGTPTEDQVLTANVSDIDGATGPISYQWQRFDGVSWVAIGGAVSLNYTLGDADVGQNIRVTASYTDDQATLENVISAQVGPIANVNDPGSVGITGTPTEDQVLTANVSDIDGLSGAVAYQWQRFDGALWNNIAGATNVTYTLGDADVGQNVRVTATYTDDQATPESLVSAPVGPIANVNDAPVVTTTAGATPYTENDLATTVDPAVTVSDVDSATLSSATVRITGGYASGEDVLSFTPAGGIGGVWNAGSGTLALTGPASLIAWNTVLQSVAYLNTSEDPTAGPRTIELLVNDGALDSVVATRTVNVAAVNDAPVVGNVTANGVEDDPSIAITLAGTDVDDPIASFALVGLPANGLLYTDAGLTALALAATDYAAAGNALTLYFVPNPDWNGATNFQFTAKDTGGLVSAAPAIAALNVAAANDAPVAGNDPGYSVSEDSSLGVGAASGVLANDTDVDSSPLTAVLVTGPGNAAAFSLNADGSFTYTPRADFYGSDTFAYQAFDGAASSNVATVTITVNNVADHTVIVDTAADYTILSPNWGDTSSIDALLKSKGADGLVSLREAIIAANNTANAGGPDRIYFEIVGPQTINVASVLPTITDAVIIDGTTDSDFAGTPVIVLNGAGAGAGVHGLTITAGGSTVRGLVINGFTQRGISLSGGGGNTIAGNYIGTNAAGTADVGNGWSGIALDNSANNTIGGNTPADRNVISGNNVDGVQLNGAGSTGNLIQGNYIGLNAAGSAAIANSESGVDIDSGASNNTVANNVISGNAQSGIEFGDPGTTGNVVVGNLIGTNAAGSSAVGNGDYGIWLAANGNRIGGVAAADRNVISGNGIDGIFVDGASGSLIQGNYIGTNAAGTAAIANAEDGIWLQGASNTQIGGTVAGARNVISGNAWSGITFWGGTGNDNRVQGNYIGTDASGTAALGNSQHGVNIAEPGSTTVGGAVPGAGNVLAYNGQDGVRVQTGTGHSILGNSIFANGERGIDLAGGGVTPNDLGDIDGGANLQMNFPVIYSVVITAGNVTITGEARPGATVEFFEAAPDPTGYGEGQTFIGRSIVSGVTPGVVDATARRFSFTYGAGSLVVGDALTATATDASGNTSEFAKNAFASTSPPGITVTPTLGLGTTEDGGTATFSVVLDSQPNATVTITLASDNPAEGTVPAAPLVFNSTNWNVVQNVTVTGVADFLTDGSVAYNIVLSAAVSTDAGYNGIDPADVAVTNQDGLNDAPVNNVPPAQIGAEDTPLVFSTGNGNLISISDSDAGPNPLIVTLTATQGAITLAGVAGLTFTVGTGTADVTMTLTGTLADINTALNGLTFDPTSGYDGPASITIDTNDQGGSGSGGPQSAASETVNITVVAVNDAPTIDLDADDSSGATGADYQRTYTEQSGTLLIIDSTDAVLGDVDSASLASLTVTITNADFDGTYEFLSADTTLTPLIVASYNAATGVLTLNGAAPIGDYELALRTIRYENTSDAPSANPRVITFVASDGGAASLPATATVTINPVNDAPTATIAAPSYAAVENAAPLVLHGTGMSVADIDALTTSIVDVYLSSISGLLSATAGSSGVTIAGSGSPSLTFTGTIAQINALLAGATTGTVTYTVGSDSPAPTDTLSLAINDRGATGTGGALWGGDSVTVNLTAVNDAPLITIPGAATTPEDTSLVFSAAGSNQISITDVDAGASPVLVTLGVSTGTLTLNAAATAGLATLAGDGTGSITMTGTVANINLALDGLTFTPLANYNGPAFLTLGIDDQGNSGTGGALTDADSMTITVTPENDAPAGADNSVSMPENTSYAFVVTDFGFTDGDAGDSMSGVRIDTLSLPPGATLRLLGVDVLPADVVTTADITAGNLVFTPALGATGIGYATFTFSVSDAAGAFDPTPNTMTVDVSNAPVNTIPGAQTVDVDTDLSITGLSVADPDFDLDTVALSVGFGTVTVTLSGAASLSAGTNGSATLTLSGTETDINATLATLVYRGGLGYAGPDTLTITSTDLLAQKDIDTIAITVSQINNPPTASIASASYAATEQVPLDLTLTNELWVDDVDAGAATVTVRISAITGNLMVNVGGTGAIVTGSGSPVATLSGTILQVQDVLLGNAGASVQYVMSSDFPPATDTLTLWINDNHATDPQTASASAAITIAAVNDAPVNTLPGGATTLEDTPLVYAGASQISVTDVDAGGAPLQVTLNVSNGVVTLGGVAGLAFTSGDGTADSFMRFTGNVASINTALNGLAFTPNLNFWGAAYITMSTNDLGASGTGGAQSDTDLATINVLPVNDAPNGTDTTVTAIEDTPYTFTLSRFGFNDVDVGDVMTDVRIDSITLPAGATLRLSGVDVIAGQIITVANINAGNLVFTPVPDANGTNYASFTFSVRDTGVPPGPLFDPVPNRMTIDVAPVNDLPIITSDGGLATAAFVVAENTTAVTTVTATDVDLQTLTYSIDPGADAGRFTINPTTGVLAFAPAPNFEAPTDLGANNIYNVTVRVSDGAGGSDTQALTITVTDVNDAPTAGSDTYAVNEDSTLTVSTASGVLANDGDEDGNPITLALVSGPGNGSLTLNPDGSFVYTPNANFFGTDSFVYRVSDGVLPSANATVTLTVNGIPDAPTSANGSVNTDEGVAYVFTLANFNYSDADGDPFDHIAITSLPTVGTLLFSGTAVAVNDVIAAADIAAGKLRYAPPVTVAGPIAEQFGFRVHDGTQYQAGGQLMTVGVAPLPVIAPPPPTGGGGGTTPPPSTSGSGGSGSGSGGSGSGSTGGDEAPPSGGGRGGSGGGESAAVAPPPVAPAEEGAKVQASDGGATNTPPTVADSSMTVRATGVDVARDGSGLGTPAVSDATKHEQEAVEAAVAAVSAPEFQEDLNKLRQQKEEDATVETRVAGTVFAASTSLSVGYVIWLLRGGVLLSSLLSSLPAWRLVDPLPVLSRLSDGMDDEDDESLEELVTQEGDDDHGDDIADDDEDAHEPAGRESARGR